MGEPALGERKIAGIREGAVVLVTAAASGIGRSIAEAFLEHGAIVHVCDIDEAAIDDYLAENPTSAASLIDVSRRQAVDQLFDEVEQRYGRLDVLVNNAGVAGPTAEIADVDPIEWERTLAIGLNGNFFCSRRAAPLLKASAGCIINIASTAGLMGCPGRAPYVAAKWAIIGLTRTLAMEMGSSGVRVNAICPGSVEGPRIDRVIRKDASRLGRSEDDVRRAYQRQTSMQQFISTDDVAHMALFLASSLGRFISGQAIGVDGHTESFSSHLGDYK